MGEILVVELFSGSPLSLYHALYLQMVAWLLPVFDSTGGHFLNGFPAFTLAPSQSILFTAARVIFLQHNLDCVLSPPKVV